MANGTARRRGLQPRRRRRRSATGKLALIDNQINQATATIRLKAIFANPSTLLWPNQFVKARLQLATRKDAIVVPRRGVQRGPKGTFVYVVGADNDRRARPIDGRRRRRASSPSSTRGSSAGEQVVVDGQNQLRPGAKVAAAAAASAAARRRGRAAPERQRAGGSGAPRPHARCAAPSAAEP